MALNPYAIRVRAALLEALPNLVQYASETDDGALLIRVPHPHIPSGLFVTTDGDEVTVGFRTWHTHGEMLGGTSPQEHVASAISLVKQILEGQVHLVVSYLDGQFNDAWVSDDPDHEEGYAGPSERLVIGTWAELAA